MRYLIILFILNLNLYCKDISIINKAFYSEDFKNYIEVKNEDEAYLLVKTKKVKNLSAKFEINKKELKDQVFYLTVVSNLENLVYTNAKYEIINKILVIKLDKNTKDIIYLNYKYKKKGRLDFRYNVINSFEYNYIFNYETFVYGTAYGIIFCAFLYYLVIYFSTRIKYFLYYSLMQLFVLLSLIAFVYLSYKSFPTIFEQAITDIFETSAFLFTLLFAKDILNAKKQMPVFNIIFIVFIVLNIVDLFAIFIYKESVLYEYMHFYVCFFIPIVAGIISLYKGNYISCFYILGWSFVFLFLVLNSYQLISISPIYTIHLVTPIESLIFSFALGYTLKKIIEDKNKKEKLLIHNNKLSSMGEMINNIAHQWRQPLAHLGFINMNLQLSIKNDYIDTKYLKEKIEESKIQLNFMSKTIDNFRDFYKINKEKNLFFISHSINNVMDIMKPLLQENKIEYEFIIKNDKQILAYENEYAQVILNIITNAKDVLISRKIQNPKIKIILKIENESIITTIEDNAGGIEEKYLECLFDPYFTTKQKGSGIGLYMSKMIIESHFNGNIQVFNHNYGASFQIII